MDFIQYKCNVTRLILFRLIVPDWVSTVQDYQKTLNKIESYVETQSQEIWEMYTSGIHPVYCVQRLLEEDEKWT